MKYIAIAVLTMVMAYGCATSHMATEMGVKIGGVYQESAAAGTVSAEESIKVWPYVSGQIKGILAGNYALEIPESLKLVINSLDELAAKPESDLTNEDKGFIIGSFCRLESEAARYGWDKYGARITGVFSKLAGL